MATSVIDLAQSDSVVDLTVDSGMPAGRAVPPQNVRLQWRRCYTVMR
jgi:hypothetical protein